MNGFIQTSPVIHALLRRGLNGTSGDYMTSLVVKRSIVLAGHKTSVSLEEPFWVGLKEIAHQQNSTISTVVGGIDILREHGNLSSAIRLFVLGSALQRTIAQPALL
jgi:predicted DNA-binding ribbon-helix-helix protein